MKIRVKNSEPPWYFLEVKRSKTLQKLNKKDCFFNILGLIFMAFLAQKLIYTVTIYLTSCLDHFLNKVIYFSSLCAHDLNMHVFQNRNWEPFHRKEFKWKKYGCTGLVSEKTDALYAELNEKVEAATSSCSATGEFLHYIYTVPVAKNDQKIRSRC